MRGAKTSLLLILLFTFFASLIADKNNAGKASNSSEPKAGNTIDLKTIEDNPVSEKAVEEDPYWHEKESEAEKEIIKTFETDTEGGDQG